MFVAEANPGSLHSRDYGIGCWLRLVTDATLSRLGFDEAVAEIRAKKRGTGMAVPNARP